MTKERIDILLHNRGFSDSREKAKRLVMSGVVFIENNRIDKPGTKVDIDSNIRIKGEKPKYVGRGGYKLEKAIMSFSIDVNDCVCIDIGASTGGFTDCLLKNNAKKVYAIDVGYGQLDWSLRNNEKVIVLEKTNFRYIDISVFKEPIDLVVVDVSFISLKNILPKVKEICYDGTEIVALVKPQFEAGKDKVGKKGIVKDRNVHFEVMRNIYKYCLDNEMYINNLTYSPIKGAEGNIEYLAYIKKGVSTKEKSDKLFNEIINSAFKSL